MILARALLAGLPALLAPAAFAQGAGAPQPAGLQKLQERLDSEMKLRGVEDTLKVSDEQRRKFEQEAEAVRTDRARLAAALIETTQRVGAAETRAAQVEKRLETLTGSEEAIRRSLEARRGIIAEVLAALQRMGRRPPPAILTRPDDILQAIRTSMLLGAVLPELRSETEALANDLNELVQLRASISTERETLARDLTALASERVRLAALVEARQKSLAEVERALDAERERARELAKQVTTLKDLIARMESEIASAARAAEEARRQDEARARSDEEKRKADAEGVRSKVAAAPFKDPARLAPQIAFQNAKGMLPLPAPGRIVKAYGAADGFGGTERGLSLATRANAAVAAPADGWVAFAGPWRTYGQLLIINAGNGYYIVLAGMERINVNVGQFVLAGEPVAVMGDGGARTAAAIAIGASEPILYVEFRKDGAAIDPGPWWAKPETEKVRG